VNAAEESHSAPQVLNISLPCPHRRRSPRPPGPRPGRKPQYPTQTSPGRIERRPPDMPVQRGESPAASRAAPIPESIRRSPRPRKPEARPATSTASAALKGEQHRHRGDQRLRSSNGAGNPHAAAPSDEPLPHRAPPSPGRLVAHSPGNTGGCTSTHSAAAALGKERPSQGRRSTNREPAAPARCKSVVPSAATRIRSRRTAQVAAHGCPAQRRSAVPVIRASKHHPATPHHLPGAVVRTQTSRREAGQLRTSAAAKGWHNLVGQAGVRIVQQAPR